MLYKHTTLYHKAFLIHNVPFHANTCLAHDREKSLNDLV